MNFDEIEKIMTEAGINICPICGTPYSKYHSRQKTCGEKECRRKWDNMRVKAWKEKQLAEDPERYRERDNEAERRYRRKKRALEERDRQLEEIQDHWQKTDDFDKYISESGMDYGKRQAEKLLASVSKINVNMGGNDYDDVHSEDDTERGGRDPEGR